MPHGDGRRIGQAQPALQHEAHRGGLGSAHEAPGDAGLLQLLEEGGIHQQRFSADEAPPLGRIPLRIAAEVEAAEHRHQRFQLRQGEGLAGEGGGQLLPAAPQQLQGGLPVVVPAALALEAVDRGRIGPPAAVVVHRFDDRAAVAAAHIADHTVDVEEQQGARVQDRGSRRLVW